MFIFQIHKETNVQGLLNEAADLLKSGYKNAVNDHGPVKVSIDKYTTAIDKLNQAKKIDPNAKIKTALTDSPQKLMKIDEMLAQAYAWRGGLRNVMFIEKIDPIANMTSAVSDYKEALRLNPKLEINISKAEAELKAAKSDTVFFKGKD